MRKCARKASTGRAGDEHTELTTTNGSRIWPASGELKDILKARTVAADQLTSMSKAYDHGTGIHHGEQHKRKMETTMLFKLGPSQRSSNQLNRNAMTTTCYIFHTAVGVLTAAQERAPNATFQQLMVQGAFHVFQQTMLFWGRSQLMVQPPF